MGNETNVKVDTTSQAAVNNSEVATGTISKPQALEKVTSIIPPKGSLEPLRPTKSPLSTEGIHVVHILFFITALVFLFSGMWRFGKKTKF